jgi:thiol-disulfide isomerase/thioredoxin
MKLPAFELIGIDDQLHGPAEFEDRKGVAVIFACNHCPHVHRYADRIKELVNRYKDQIGFIAISSNDVVNYPADGFEEMKEFGPRLGFDSHYLYDESQQVARDFQAQRTPEVFLFGNDDQLVYHGTIDDSKDFPEAVQFPWFKDAIEAVIAGEEVAVSKTEPVGCTIKWKM